MTGKLVKAGHRRRCRMTPRRLATVAAFLIALCQIILRLVEIFAL